MRKIVKWLFKTKIGLATITSVAVVGGVVVVNLPATHSKMDNVNNKTPNKNEVVENNDVLDLGTLTDENETNKENNEVKELTQNKDNNTSNVVDKVVESKDDSETTKDDNKNTVEKDEGNVKPTESDPKTEPAEESKKPDTKNYAEYIENLAKEALNLDSAHFLTNTTYKSSKKEVRDEVWFSRSQNRRYSIYDGVTEYLEGQPGRYTTDKLVSRYNYQDHWTYNNETNSWGESRSFYSGLGISHLLFLTNVKSAELLSKRAHPSYLVTIDKDVANKAVEDCYNITNAFKNDIKLVVLTEVKTGKLYYISSSWKESDFNKTSDYFTMNVVIDGWDSTTVDRPKDLKNVEIHDYPKKDEFTATKKYEYSRLIEKAYAKTRDANSLTYTLNGTTMKYDKKKNEALLTTSNSTTYYKGTEGSYIDHDYVGPTYHQKSWTKLNSTGTWKENTTKHTTFTPQELYFLNHIFTVDKVERNDDITTYTVEILKYDANLAYSHVYGVSNKFNDKLVFKVSVDKEEYIRGIEIDFGDSELNLKIDDVNNTEVVKPQGLN